MTVWRSRRKIISIRTVFCGPFVHSICAQCQWYAHTWAVLKHDCLKQKSIALASSELAPN